LVVFLSFDETASVDTKVTPILLAFAIAVGIHATEAITYEMGERDRVGACMSS
jgi:hypothetical protein